MGTEADRSGRMSTSTPAMATTAMPSLATPAAQAGAACPGGDDSG